MNVEAAVSIWQELETLAVVHWTLLLIDLKKLIVSKCLSSHQILYRSSTYQESSSDHDENAAGVNNWLGVEGCNLVLNLGEWKALQKTCQLIILAQTML